MKKQMIVSVLVSVWFLSACDSGVNSPRGFSLPKGDVDKGREVFLAGDCLACHSLSGFNVEMEATTRQIGKRVLLGGKTKKITTYAELVTSIINPSHKISRGTRPYNRDAEGNSSMRNYNQELSVQELIDLVTFMETKYEVTPYPYTDYRPYGITFN